MYISETTSVIQKRTKKRSNTSEDVFDEGDVDDSDDDTVDMTESPFKEISRVW